MSRNRPVFRKFCRAFSELFKRGFSARQEIVLFDVLVSEIFTGQAAFSEYFWLYQKNFPGTEVPGFDYFQSVKIISWRIFPKCKICIITMFLLLFVGYLIVTVRVSE